MRTFRNTSYEKRDYECTNVVACTSHAPPSHSYEECDPELLEGLTQLWTQDGVTYWGYL